MSDIPTDTKVIIFRGKYQRVSSSLPCPNVGLYLKFTNGCIGATTHGTMYSTNLLVKSTVYTIEKAPSSDIILTGEYDNIDKFISGPGASDWGWYIAEVKETDGWEIVAVHPAYFKTFKKIKNEYLMELLKKPHQPKHPTKPST